MKAKSNLSLREVLILINTKSLKKKLLIFCMLITLSQATACDRVEDTTLPSNASDNINSKIESSVSLNIDEIKPQNFLKSSQQDGYFLDVEGKIVSKVWQGMVFDKKAEDGKYKFYKTIDDYLDLEGNYYIDKIFSYGEKIIYIGRYRDSDYNEYGEMVIQNISTNKKDIIKIEDLVFGNTYILGNKVYYGSYITDDNYNNIKFIISYINIDTLEQKTVFEYNGMFDNANFVLREDGAIAFLINDLNGMSSIFKYESEKLTKLIQEKWCTLVDFDNRGVFYTEPGNTDEELSKLEYPSQADEFRFTLLSENGQVKILLKRKEDDANTLADELKVFDDFFILINSENTYYSDYVEKYNFEGTLIRKINLNVWPILGKEVLHEANVILYDGVLQNIFYRRDTEDLEIQTINLD